MRRAYFIAILFIVAAAGLLVPLPSWLRHEQAAKAANPPAGSIGPNGPPLVTFNGTWRGTATGGVTTNPLDGEAGCTEGETCDTFTLTVLPGNYSGKVLQIDVTFNQADDYDLVIYKGGTCPATGKCTGQLIDDSGNGATSGVLGEEHAAIDPSATGAGDYRVRMVYFAVPPPVTDARQYTATVTVVTAPTARNAVYAKGGISFTPNVTVKAPAAARDGEPSLRTDFLGNTYVGAIRGVPAGVDLWYFDLRPTIANVANPAFDPFMRNWVYRGQPDSFTDEDAVQVGADGGGDIDLSVGFPNPGTGATNDPPTLATSSLVAANISTQRSQDRGATFAKNPLGNATGGVPGDDRQWHEFYGKDVVYLLYRTLAPTVTQIQRSVDGGLTYGPAKTAGLIGQVGSIDVHQATGAVYISGSTGQVCVGEPLVAGTDPLRIGAEPLTYTCRQVTDTSETPDNIFFVVKVADDGTANGTAYVVYSDGQNVYLRHSTDKGATWSQRVRVSDGPETKTSLLPWMETGPDPGTVGVVWYGTTSESNSDTAQWKVFFSQSFNASSANPTFRQVEASDHVIHGSNISTGGTLGDKNRNLIDYFQISFDPTGAAVIAYTDDHNDFDGHTYVTRQASGPSILGKVIVPSPGAAPAPIPTPADGAQVTDFLHDVTTGQLGKVETDDPFDITSIKYSCETGAGGEPVIVATMKVSDLTVIPPNSNWRMNFTANAPFRGTISPVGDYSFALSDQGDQFWVRASTNAAGAQTFTYGTTERIHTGDGVGLSEGGTLAYTERGAADCGAFDQANKTITVKVSAGKLNAFAPKGAITAGSVIAGLRGQTFTSSANAKRDLTRGGTEFAVVGCGASPATGCAAAGPGPGPGPTPTPDPNASTSVFQFNSAAFPLNEACAAITVTVTRTGVTNTRATVDFTSNDGTAKQKGDYTFATGRLIFEPNEVEKTFQLLVNEDSYTEGPETATVVLQNPQNGTLGAPSTASLQILDDVVETTGNPIDDARNFVCQQYHDFLYRQPDQAGEDFWTERITSCGNNADCVAARRANVSAAFFLSIEFQQTGYFVIRTHKAAFGSDKSRPKYIDFLRDQRQIGDGVVIGTPGSFERLEANRQRFLEEFVSRTEFVNVFPQGQPAATYVDTMFANAGVTPTAAERSAAIAAYGAGDLAGRAAALRSVADSDSVYAAQYNPAFVLMQYFGYMRRNPNDPPDVDFRGYDFWLEKLDDFSLPGENVRNETVALARVARAQMVEAFITSIEYRDRFGGASGGNQQGAPVTSAAARPPWRIGLGESARLAFRALFGQGFGRASPTD